MKIYTKKGDQGSTGLIGGTRVSKGDVRIEAYGTVDELNSYIGLISTLDINLLYVAQLQEIQDRLFTIGSHLAADPEKSKMQLPDLLESDVEKLEHWMDVMDEALPPLTAFIFSEVCSRIYSLAGFGKMVSGALLLKKCIPVVRGCDLKCISSIFNEAPI